MIGLILKKYKIYVILGGVVIIGALWAVSLVKVAAYERNQEANRWRQAHQEAVTALQARLKEVRAEGRENVKAAENRAHKAQNEANQRIRALLREGNHADLAKCRAYTHPNEYIDALWLRE